MGKIINTITIYLLLLYYHYYYYFACGYVQTANDVGWSLVTRVNCVPIDMSFGTAIGLDHSHNVLDRRRGRWDLEALGRILDFDSGKQRQSY